MNELFDMRTILLFDSLLSLAICLLMIHYASTQKTYAGFSHWTAAAFLASVGSLLVGLRDLVPVFVSIIIANLSLTCSWLLVKRGLEAFFNQEPSYRLDAALFVLFSSTFSYYTMGAPNLTARVVLVSVYLGYLSLHSARITRIGTTKLFSSSKSFLPYWLLTSGLVCMALPVVAFFEHLLPLSSFMAINLPHKICMIIVSCMHIVIYFGLISLFCMRSTSELVMSQNEVKVLKGFLPICMHCKSIYLDGNIKEDPKSWKSIESYISQHSEAEFTHSICPNCIKEHYSEHYSEYMTMLNGK